MFKGAADLNLSESISGLCTPYDLVEYFQRSSNFQLEKHLKGIEKSEKSLYNSMEYRLKLVTPFIDRYHQAMGLSLEPSNVPRSLQVLRELSDVICIGGLGDKSTDVSKHYLTAVKINKIRLSIRISLVVYVLFFT